MTDEQLVEIIAKHSDKAVTAGEVAEAAGMTNSGVLQRLNDLAEENAVAKKEVGSRAVVWWVKNA